MAMTSSIVINRPDGDQQFIRELHIDVLTIPHQYEYYPPQTITQIELDANLAANAIEIEGSIAESEAEIASETDTVIIAGDYADVGLMAIKYLRKAYDTYDSLEAYKKYDRFNDFRVEQSWSLNQVVAGLADVGLTQAEWDIIYARYAYLALPVRVAAMTDYQTVLNGDPRP